MALEYIAVLSMVEIDWSDRTSGATAFDVHVNENGMWRILYAGVAHVAHIYKQTHCIQCEGNNPGGMLGAPNACSTAQIAYSA